MNGCVQVYRIADTPDNTDTLDTYSLTCQKGLRVVSGLMGCVTEEASERCIHKLRDRREGRMEDGGSRKMER